MAIARILGYRRTRKGAKMRRIAVCWLLSGCTGVAWFGDRDADGDGEPRRTDCDDEDAAVFPGAEEVCNGKDDDCDGEVDAADDDLPALGFADDDGDGFGALWEPSCQYVAVDGDCDDDDPDVYPGAPEVPCDGVDQNCVDDETYTAVIDGVPYKDLERALINARDQDDVVVCPGVQVVDGAFVLNADGLTLRGITNNPADTVITRSALVNATIAITGSVTFSGIGFTDTLPWPEDRTTSPPPCLSTYLGATVLDHVTFDGCYGAALAVQADAATLRDVRVIGNGGRPFPPGGAVATLRATTVVIDHALFSDNVGGTAGALALEGVADGRLTDVGFLDNRGDVGGGLYISVGLGALTVSGTTFEGNHADRRGGAVALELEKMSADATITFTDTTFVDNDATTETEGEVTDGGAIFGAFGTDFPTHWRFERVDFAENSAYEAAVSLTGPGSVAFIDTTVADSSSKRGHAVTLDGPGSSWSDTQVFRNDATAGAVSLGLTGPTRASFANADFGEGGDQNRGHDLTGCEGEPHVGLIVDAQLDATDPCPP